MLAGVGPRADLIEKPAERSWAVTERSEGNREAVDGPVERSYWLLVPVGCYISKP